MDKHNQEFLVSGCVKDKEVMLNSVSWYNGMIGIPLRREGLEKKVSRE